MRACESSRPILGRLYRAIVALALVCVAPSVWATATGTLTKRFDGNAAQTVALGGETLMTLVVSISYSSGSANLLSITDTLPAGMVVAPAVDQPPVTSTCTAANATFTATPGSHSVSYSWYDGTAHRAGLSCQLRVMLKAVQVGAWTNTGKAVSGGDLPGQGPGITVTDSAVLTVTGPPVLTRDVSGFQPGTTDGTLWAVPGNPLTLHYTLTNPNTALTQTGVGFTENFPSGLGSLGGVTNNTCFDGNGSGNTVTLSSSGIVMSGVQLAAGASCALDVSFSANSAGTYTLGATAPTSNETGAGTAVAAVTFLAFTQPHSWMVTNPSNAVIPLDGSGTMTLVLESTSTVDVGGVGFSATLPSGLAVADSSTTQCGGTATASAQTGKLTLTGAVVPANTQCNVDFTVTGTQVGDQYADSVVTVHGVLVHSDFGAYFTVQPLATTTTLASMPATPVHGQNVTFTATVSLPSGSSRAAVGTVAFTENGNPLPGGCAGAATVSGGIATCTTQALATSSHHVVATFTPTDGNTKTSAGSADVAVGKAATTTSIANAQPWTITLGASTTVNVTVAANAPGSGVPTGSVTVSDGAGAQCTIASLASGSGSCALTPVGAGTKSVTATYAADANFAGSAASASLAVNASQPVVVLASSVNPSVFGQAVTVTGRLTPAAGGVAPGGAVHFYVDAAEVCANAVLTPVGATKSVSATCAIPQAMLSVGGHALRFDYAGDANNKVASASLTQTVSVAQTTTTLTVPPSSVLGDAVTIGVKVSANAPGAGVPVGDVAVGVGGQVCHATLDATGAGSCALTPPAPAGDKTVTADYGGAASFATSSGTATLHVVAASTTTTLSAPATAVYGESVTFTATISLPSGNAGTAAGTVAFTENGNPLPGGCASAATVSGGIATCTTQALATSSHHVVATFTPSDGNTTGSAGSADVTVGKAATTTTIANAQPWTITFGASTTVNVTVATNAPGSGAPSGTVTISDGDAGSGDHCTITLPVTGCTLTPGSAGTKTLSATFTPDAASIANLEGSSATAALTVERAEQATLAVTATPDLLIPGMTSQLAASGGSGSGDISYAVDSGPCTVSGSVATATGVGACVVRATKAADANYNATSATATITVQAANLPVAQAQSVGAILNTPQAIQLVGSDDNIGGPYALTYTIGAAPAHGTIGGMDASSGTLTYTPPSNYVGTDSFSFTVTSTNGVSQPATVTIDVTAPQLTLSIEDGIEFARYGQVVDYTVTLTNGSDAANAVPVQFTLSPGFDAQGASVNCSGATGGAICTQDAGDPLRFTVTLPPGRTLTWLVAAPVRGDATDDAVTFDAHAVGASDAADTNTLVIFRDGFDAAASTSTAARVVEGEQARAILAGADDNDATVPVVVPDDATALSPAAWLIVRDAASEARVEGIRVAGTWLVRLHVRDANAGERASAWSAVEPGAVLMFGAVSGENGQRVLLLEGAREPLALH